MRRAGKNSLREAAEAAHRQQIEKKEKDKKAEEESVKDRML